MATQSYLFAVFHANIPTLGNVFLIAYGLGIFVAFVLVIAETRRGLHVQFREDSPRKVLRIAPMKALRIAIYSSVFYSVFSVVLAGFAASQPIGDWGPTNLLTRVMICVAVVWVLLVSLIPLVLLLASTVPSFATSQNSQPRSSGLK